MKLSWTFISRLLLLLIVPIYSGSFLLAQSGTSSALSGIVTDATGATMPGATVTGTFVSTQAQRTTVTGRDGAFLFLQLSAGTYRISVQAVGFAPTAQEVTYTGVPLRLNFKLVTEALRTEIIVNAQDLDAAAPARVDISHEQIERIPSQSVSSPLSSLITVTTPGVSEDSNGSFPPL